MNILAMELATARAGVALVSAGRELGSRQWTDDRLRDQSLFCELRALREETGVDFRDVDAFVVDIGPGSFNGIRQSLSAARGFALPAGRRVLGVPCPEAIAAQALDEEEADCVAVAGDARRGCLWLAAYRRGAGVPSALGPIALLSPGELAAAIPAGSVVVTPDWERIGQALRAVVPPRSRLIEEPRFPSARTLARLARPAAEGAQAAPAPAPIYLHPPVAAKPRSEAGPEAGGGNGP
jgi:tRNA threonylcarbamoyladenosine biosynthesis protein TsaB